MVLTVFAATRPAAAQSRPYRGLFASGVSAVGQSLSARGSLMSGWDQNLGAVARNNQGVGDPTRAQAGTVIFGSASLAYGLSSDLFKLSASVSTSDKYYPGLDVNTRPSTYARVTVSRSIAIGRDRSLSVSGYAAYQPYIVSSALYGPLEPEVPETPVEELDLAYYSASYVSYGGSVGMSEQLGKQTTFSTGYGYRRRWSSQSHSQFDRHAVHARLTHQIGRGLSARAGYAYSRATYIADGHAPLHTIDVGVDYNRPLSISRRTTLSFGTGMGAAKSTTLSDGGNADGRLHVRATGFVALSHELGRTWSASVSYHRRMYLHEGWGEPVIGDGVSARLTGLITRRLQFMASFRGSLGTVGVESNAPGFDNTTATAAVGYALNRYAQCYAGYTYYTHKFAPGAALPGVPLLADRQSFRSGITLWAPLMNRGGANASR
jgi:hypothetical protein